MLNPIADTINTREYLVSITSKGQMTVPASVRQYLKLNKHRKVAVAIEPSGTVTLKIPQFSTLESMGGSVKPLARPVSKKEIEDIITNDIAREYRAKNP